jgi:hypothetical protein
MRRLGLLAICISLLSCGSEGSGNDQCSTLSSTGDGSGCFGLLPNALPHQCEAMAQATCQGSAANSTCTDATLATCATSYYLRNYADDTLPNCSASHPPLTIGDGTLKLELSLYRYPRVPDSGLVQHTQGLQRYYAANQLTMTTNDVAQTDLIRYAIGGTMAEVTQALIDAGLDPNNVTTAQEDQATQIVGDVLFKPTREFLERHAIPAEGKVNVTAIDQIVAPEMVTPLGIAPGTYIVGLGLSSTLIDQLSADSSSGTTLNTMLNIDSDFTPTLFVGHTDIARLTGNFDLVVAHEMGHALGLPHVTDAGNLMQQGGSLDCRPWLSQDQVDIMGPFSGVVLTADDALSRIWAGRRNVVRYLRERH